LENAVFSVAEDLAGTPYPHAADTITLEFHLEAAGGVVNVDKLSGLQNAFHIAEDIHGVTGIEGSPKDQKRITGRESHNNYLMKVGDLT
jgi:hypothetical protein